VNVDKAGTGIAEARPPRRRGQRDRGVALVEFAMVLPLLCLLIFGVIDFGFMVNRDTLINNAAREGAREGTLNTDHSDIVDVVESSLSSLDFGNLTVTVTCRNADTTACTSGEAGFDADAGSGDVVIVNVRYEYDWITPLPGFFTADDSVTLEKTVEMRIE
jgi:Flp pilus assembly protein TadG